MGDPQPMRYAPQATAVNPPVANGQDQSRGPLASFLGGLANNLLFLLLGLGILGGALWFMRGGFNQPNNFENTLPPPPPGDQSFNANPNRIGDDRSNSASTGPQVTAIPNNTPRTTAQTQGIPNQAAQNLAAQREAAQRRAASNQPKLPVAGFFVRTPAVHDGVNLRVGPGVSNPRIRAIPDGYWVVDEGQQQGNWRQVSFQGQRGWVYRPFIQ
ncbi:MAG: hypothetical protein HC805_05995 [Alkalinema sp. RL_2_19]|nr:hypothetical protein [Alkalinema sp. RL_2_19]